MQKELKINTPSDIMTINECAKHLKTSRTTVYRLAQQGEIPAIKLGNQWRFRRERIEEWLTKKEKNR